MKTFSDKQKKLNTSLQKLKDLNLINSSQNKQTIYLKEQKNQLEIEKNQLETKYKSLIENYQKLKDRLKKQDLEQKNREMIFDEKIDELNQETDILMKEVDKWQT
tara:strand:- start:380 stop:694 length:315 start_codon:yes stop_codon:yes gene_type:complete